MSEKGELIPDSLLWPYTRCGVSKLNCNHDKVRIGHSLFDPRPDLSDLSFPISTSPNVPSVADLPIFREKFVW